MGMAQRHPVTGTKETILDLVRILPPEKRRTLSVELAARSDAPADLMRFLALDEIVIAEPVILHSPVLSEDDLCEIAMSGSPAHLSRLRQRPNLPERVLTLLEAPDLEPRLLETLRKRSVEEFRSLFVAAIGDEAAGALEALRDGDAQPLVRTCKKTGLSRCAYSSIVILSDVGHARSPEVTETLLTAFETVQAA